MNSKGAGMLIAIMTALFIFIAGMLFLNHVTDDVSLATSSLQLDCDNTSISDGAKVMCLGIDIVIPYLILAILSLVIGTITARLLI